MTEDRDFELQPAAFVCSVAFLHERSQHAHTYTNTQQRSWQAD